MKAVLMSLKPQWWDKMLSGEKTEEIRKTAPMEFKDASEPFHVFVYISGTNEVRGHFLCPEFERTNELRRLSGPSCVPAADLHRYAGPKGEVVAWSVKDPVALSSPLPLSTFGVKRAPMSWQYIDVSSEVLAQLPGSFLNFFSGVDHLPDMKLMSSEEMVSQIHQASDMTGIFAGAKNLRYKRRYADCQRPDGNCNLCPLFHEGLDCHKQPVTKLELARLNKGMSIVQLSSQTGVNERQIQKVEKGEIQAGNMTARNLLAIARVLEVDPQTLI